MVRSESKLAAVPVELGDLDPRAFRRAMLNSMLKDMDHARAAGKYGVVANLMAKATALRAEIAEHEARESEQALVSRSSGDLIAALVASVNELPEAAFEALEHACIARRKGAPRMRVVG